MPLCDFCCVLEHDFRAAGVDFFRPEFFNHISYVIYDASVQPCCAVICANFVAFDISAGIVDGEVRLDLNYIEDSHAQVDSNVVLTRSGKIIEFQTTAEGEPYEQSQMMEIFNIAKKGIDEVIAMYEKI